MNLKLKNLLKSQSIDADGFFSSPLAASHDQVSEIAMREHVAAAQYDNYLDAISCSHSIAVMDHEVDRFLAKIPQGGLRTAFGWHAAYHLNSSSRLRRYLATQSLNVGQKYSTAPNFISPHPARRGVG